MGGVRLAKGVWISNHPISSSQIMLRCCIGPSKALASLALKSTKVTAIDLRSCVRIDVGSSATFLHTSANLQAESNRKRTARATRKENRALKQDRQRLNEATKPSVVLGTRPGDEFKWLDCDLAKTIVAPDSSLEYDTLERPIGKVMLPKQLSWGVGEVEKALLFEALPPLSAEARVRVSPAESRLTAINEHVREAESVELEKTNTFAKLLDLRNADAGGIAYENRRRIIFEFSTPENPFDTGRPEVQGIVHDFAFSIHRH